VRHRVRRVEPVRVTAKEAKDTLAENRRAGPLDPFLLHEFRVARGREVPVVESPVLTVQPADEASSDIAMSRNLFPIRTC